MTNTTIAIKARYATLQEAFDAAVAQGILDISYNPQAARSNVRSTQLPFRDGSRSLEAFICEDNNIYFVYQCDIRILNKFDPFISILDNSDLRLVVIKGDQIEIINDARFPKTKEGRKAIGDIQAQSEAILAC